MDWKRYAFLLGVTASALYATPQLQLSTTALGPLNIAPNTAGATQTVGATNIGDGSLSLAVSASATWLQPSVVGNSSVQIALNTASLTPGTYTEFVTVLSPGAIDAPQNITVTVQVGGVPATLTYYAAPGGAPVTQQVITQGQVTATAATNSGSGSVSLSIVPQGKSAHGNSMILYFPPTNLQGVNFASSPFASATK